MISMKTLIEDEKNGLKKLCVAVNSAASLNTGFIGALKERIENDVDVIVVNNFTQKADSLSDMSNVDGIILIEELERSKFKDVAEELSLCSNYGVKVVGAVVVE